MSLSREFVALRALSNEALVGRAFQMMDENGDGSLSREEFVEGVQQLLHPTTPAATALVSRLRAGQVREVRSMTFNQIASRAGAGRGASRATRDPPLACAPPGSLKRALLPSASPFACPVCVAPFVVRVTCESFRNIRIQ